MCPYPSEALQTKTRGFVEGPSKQLAVAATGYVRMAGTSNLEVNLLVARV
jgi:hypothetical protein